MLFQLPSFINNVIENKFSEKKDDFYKLLNSIVKKEEDQYKIRHLIYDYLMDKKKSTLNDEDQFIVLTLFLLSYWSKDYEPILEIYNKFKKVIDKENLTLIFCYLLTLREMFLIEEYKNVNSFIEKLINDKLKSEKKEFLILSLNEFSSIIEGRPEFGYKALNEILRFLINIDDLSESFPFVLDALMCDLVNFAYTLADDTLKDIWVESAVKRAKNIDNKGMLCSLYDLQSKIAIKEYNIQEAKINIDLGLKFAKEIRSSRLEAILNLNTAIMEQMSGRLSQALEKYQEILKTGDLTVPLKIQTLSKIGDIYILDEKYEKAEEYYDQAHGLNKENGFVSPIVEIVHGYIQFLLGKDEGETMDYGLKLAEDQFDFNAMSYFYFYKGLYNQKKVNFSTAVEFYERSLGFFENQLIIEGIVYSSGALAECYFEMFRITENNVYGSSFLYYIDNLLNITKELAHPLYIDAIMTKASYYQFRNIETKVIEALEQGLEFAEEQKLEERIDEIKIRLRDKASLIQELRASKGLFNKIMTFSFGSHKKIPIILYLLLVLDESGLPLYSYKFSKKEVIDDLLVSGLISAIINFSAEVLGKGTETLRSINHEGKAVIIEKQDNVMAVLVADNETFESRLQVRKFLKESISKIKVKLELKAIKEEEFHPLVESIFESSLFEVE